MNKLFKPLLIANAVAAMMTAGAANAWTTVSPVALTNNTPVTLSIRTASFSDPAFGYQAWAMHGKWATFNAVKGQKVTIAVDGSAVADLHPAFTVWKRPIGTPEQPFTWIQGGKTMSMTNLTPAKYVPDHNFNPMQSYIESGATQQHIQGSGGGSCSDATVTCATETKTITGTDGVPMTITAKSVEFWKAAKRTAPVNGATPVLLEDGTTEIGLPRMIRVVSAADNDAAPIGVSNINKDPNLLLPMDGVPGKVERSFVPDRTAQYQIFIGGYNPGPIFKDAPAYKDVVVTVQGAAE
jgi:hypothetical protein